MRCITRLRNYWKCGFPDCKWRHQLSYSVVGTTSHEMVMTSWTMGYVIFNYLRQWVHIRSGWASLQTMKIIEQLTVCSKDNYWKCCHHPLFVGSMYWEYRMSFDMKYIVIQHFSTNYIEKFTFTFPYATFNSIYYLYKISFYAHIYPSFHSFIDTKIV